MRAATVSCVPRVRRSPSNVSTSPPREPIPGSTGHPEPSAGRALPLECARIRARIIAPVTPSPLPLSSRHPSLSIGGFGLTKGDLSSVLSSRDEPYQMNLNQAIWFLMRWQRPRNKGKGAELLLPVVNGVWIPLTICKGNL